MSEVILGISSFYHDSAAALIINGEIIAAAQEERFTRIKHDSAFPTNAVKYVLSEAAIELKDVQQIAFYDKPFLKFERLLDTYHSFAPNGIKSFFSSMPVWIKEKLFMKKMLKDELSKIDSFSGKILFPEHHLSHAASAFYPSPFEKAAILTIDGVGEWATTTICKGIHEIIEIHKELHFPHSLGLLYSAFTYYLGFRVNSGEYKLMGLAPYGNPDAEETKMFKKLIEDNLIDIKPDGSIILNMEYFNYATGLRMTNDKKWFKLFGVKRRKAEAEDISQTHMNMAMAIQQITEDVVILLAKHAKQITDCENLVLAGGVALNCVANGKLITENIFQNIWIQPAAGDAGGALGAALATHFISNKNKRVVNPFDSMNGSYLGPEFGEKVIKHTISKYNAVYNHFVSFEELSKKVAKLIDEGNVIGWFQGKMEFGPRALGNRSIIGDARNPEMQKKMNLKIKYREGFRPFAPSILEEDVSKIVELNSSSPYMLVVVPIHESLRKKLPHDYYDLELYDRLYVERSQLPAITHIDFSARVQSVSKRTNPRYWTLINEFKKNSNFGVIINTSFNVRGEPIVCSPDDAFRCFMRTEMDYLVIGDYLFNKKEQKEIINDTNWKEEFKLD